MEYSCYNRGCGKTFLLTDNTDSDNPPCKYHPGEPIFHDAYKSWSCCSKKSTDFTQFLNFPGCTSGMHSHVKPIAPVPTSKPKVDGADSSSTNDDLNTDSSVKCRSSLEEIKSRTENTPRPDFHHEPLTCLKPEISKSLRDKLDKEALEKENSDGIKQDDCNDSSTSKKDNSVNNMSDCCSIIEEGESCKNRGCKKTFHSSDEYGMYDCQYHNGVPVFHEGMKFWSCCNKKTSDFQAFLEQVGCESGPHRWKEVKGDKSDEKAEKATTRECRYDWHQTASKVTLVIYAKNYDIQLSNVSMNGVRMKCCLIFKDGGPNFILDLHLRGVISVENTSLLFCPTKVEIIMSKSVKHPCSWSSLSIPIPVTISDKSIPDDTESTSDSCSHNDVQNATDVEMTQKDMEREDDVIALDDLTLQSNAYRLSEDARSMMA